MKTSVIEVHDMLSVLSVDDVEKRISEVPGVESATVNYAAGNVTVRFDETRLEIADIKSAVRQRGYESAAPAPSPAGEHTSHATLGAPPAPPSPVTPKAASVAPATAGAASSDSAPQSKPAPTTAPSTMEGGSKKSTPST